MPQEKKLDKCGDLDISDCDLGLDFPIPGSGIKKFLIPGSCFQD